MFVRSVTVRNFMVAGEAVLHLPETGVTVITGDNGAGKSRFIEAVSSACWGRTLRGRKPWRAGEVGMVEVANDCLTITRSVTKGGRVSVALGGDPAGDTATKAQERLSAVLPEFETWWRTHVFSAADAAHFSEATDAERKRLIEGVLGLHVFDEAQQRAAVVRTQTADQLSSLRGELARAQAVVARLEGRLSAWQPMAPFEEEPEPEEPATSTGSSDELEAAAEAFDAEHAELLQQTMGLEPDVAIERRHDAALRALDEAERHAELVSRGECPTCGQRFPGNAAAARVAVTAASAEVDAATRAWRADIRAVELARQTSRDRLATLTQQARDARKAAAECRHELRRYEAWQAAQASWAERQDARRGAWKAACVVHVATRKSIAEELADAQDNLEELEARCAELDRKVRTADFVSRRVLGTQGLRAVVLGKALAGLEIVANYWLEWMAPGVQLRVSPYSTTERGLPSERISLEVEGFGGAEGYKAASGGERRRINTALLLGLAEISSGHGTLWLDEVFDALDERGQAAVCDVLDELGRERSVVVITHRSELAARIPAVQRLRVEGGGLV